MGYAVMIHKIQVWLGQTKVIWADKIALLFGALFSSLLLSFWLLAFLIVGTAGAEHLWRTLGFLGFGLDILITGLVWLVMRTADYLAGGGARTAFRSGGRLLRVLVSGAGATRIHTARV